MFCVDIKKVVPNLDYAVLCFLFVNIIKFNNFCMILLYCNIWPFLFHFTRSLVVPYAYESNDFILLPSFEIKIISLISPIRTLCLSLLNLCRVSNINSFFCLWNLYDNFLWVSMSIPFFSRCFILFSSGVASK